MSANPSKPEKRASADAALFEHLRSGCREALGEVFDAYGDRLYRLALGIRRDEAEAEDVVQEAFLRLLTRLDEFRGDARLSTWPYRVT